MRGYITFRLTIVRVSCNGEHLFMVSLLPWAWRISTRMEKQNYIFVIRYWMPKRVYASCKVAEPGLQLMPGRWRLIYWMTLPVQIAQVLNLYLVEVSIR